MFSDTIKKKRKELGLTQKDFAKKLGVSYRTYQDWENNKHQPTDMTKDLILEMLKYM